MVDAAGELQSAEGRATWLLVALVALVFALLPAWVVLGGKSPGPLPSTPANPVSILGPGQKIAYATGDLVTGDGIECEGNGLVVGAWVPKPGHTTRARVVGANSAHSATITIRTESDGVVVARCY